MSLFKHQKLEYPFVEPNIEHFVDEEHHELSNSISLFNSKAMV